MKEKQAIVADWNEMRARIEAMPLPSGVATLVDRAAQLFGDRTAWSFFERGEKYSFREVQTLSLRTAGLFRELGIKRGDNVAVMVENSGVYLGSWLGLARLGAAIVPVNTRYTARELAHVLQLSQARALVIDAELLPIAAAVDAPLEALQPENLMPVGRDSGKLGWERRLAQAPLLGQTESLGGLEDILNIQFTSGTTGFPKGCAVPQRYWIQAALSWGEYLDKPIGNVLLNQRLFYIDGQFLAMVCLYKGATYHMCSKPSVAKFPDWLQTHEIDYCWYAEPLFKSTGPGANPSTHLKLMHIFGFSPANHAALEARYKVIARESFGMSEFAPALMMPLDAEAMVGSGSCGLPAPATSAKIIDEAGNVVAPGETGELCFKSVAMMRGYYNDPAASSETIVDGWLKTGDLARQDSDGFFYIVGRKKDMVRKNSENISCREVEEIIRRMPQVQEAAMVAVKDPLVGEEPKVYLKLIDGLTVPEVPPSSVIEFCRAHLASFKIPRYLQYVETFPMTESARVAKKVLIAGIDDLRAGSYDALTGTWHPPAGHGDGAC